MRYDLTTSIADGEVYCVRDRHRSPVVQGDVSQNGGDVVCLRPGIDDHEASEVHWPENARLIVALLNYADRHSLTADWLESQMLPSPMMQIPGERVEFRDDIQPVTPAVTPYICDKCKSPLWVGYTCDACGNWAASDNPAFAGS